MRLFRKGFRAVDVLCANGPLLSYLGRCEILYIPQHSKTISKFINKSDICRMIGGINQRKLSLPPLTLVIPRLELHPASCNILQGMSHFREVLWIY